MLLLLGLTMAMTEIKVELLMTTASLLLTKELIEYVLMGELTIWVLPLSLSFNSLLAMLIVNFALFRVRECLVRVCDLLELCLCLLWVLLIFIRVELDG